MIFSKLAPMKAITVILKRPLGTLRTRWGHRFNNPVSEGINGKTQTVRSAGREFHRFES